MMLASMIISQSFVVGKGEKKGGVQLSGNIAMWICNRCAESEGKRGQLDKTRLNRFCTPVLLQAAFPASVLSLSLLSITYFPILIFIHLNTNPSFLSTEANIKLFSHRKN